MSNNVNEKLGNIVADCMFGCGPTATVMASGNVQMALPEHFDGETLAEFGRIFDEVLVTFDESGHYDEDGTDYGVWTISCGSFVTQYFPKSGENIAYNLGTSIRALYGLYDMAI